MDELNDHLGLLDLFELDTIDAFESLNIEDKREDDFHFENKDELIPNEDIDLGEEIMSVGVIYLY